MNSLAKVSISFCNSLCLSDPFFGLKFNDQLNSFSHHVNFNYPQIMRQRRIDRGALTLASAEVKFQIDTETHDPLDIGMWLDL